MEQAKWPGFVMIVISLVVAFIVPQDVWWGKIIFWIAIIWLVSAVMLLWRLFRGG